MKKFLIIILVLLTFLTIFWSLEYYKKDNIYVINEKNIALLDVQENNVICEIFNAEHLNSWNYKYEIKDRNLYLTTYKLSYFNPKAIHSWLGVRIDTGYNEIDNIYIKNGVGTEQILIWNRDHIFSTDKLSDLNVNGKEFSCKLDYEYWDYKYDLQSRILYIDIYEKEEKNTDGLNIEIDKGYDDFDEVILVGLGNKKVIWSKFE